MQRIVNHAPSPATMISLVALFVALGGTGYALSIAPKNSVGSAQVINGSLLSKDLSRKTVAALKGTRGPAGAAGVQGAVGPAGAIGPAGATGPAGAAGATGSPGTTGAAGVAGPSGPPGPAGTARAYAEVNRDPAIPVLVAARTKNFTAVNRVAQGVYCLTPAAGIDARAVATVASEDFEHSIVNGIVEVRGEGLACATGQFEVETILPPDSTTNGISFTLIVP